MLIAGCLLLSAAILSLVGSGLAAPVSYVGVALGLFERAIPPRLLFTVTVDARIEWLVGWGTSSSIDIAVDLGGTDE